MPVLLVTAAGSQLMAPDQHFEVASLKVNRLGDVGRRFESPVGSGATAADGDPLLFRRSNITLQMLVLYAYNLRPYQLVREPVWFSSKAYDITAKCPKPSSWPEKMLMLRALLAERVQLKTHFEKRQMAAYGLVVSKAGSKLHLVTDEQIRQIEGSPVGPQSMRWFGTTASFADHISFMVSMFNRSDDESAKGIPIVDETGLPGKYDFTIKKPYHMEDDFLGNLERVITPQLGLTLKREVKEVIILVIDNVVSIPSEN